MEGRWYLRDEKKRISLEAAFDHSLASKGLFSCLLFPLLTARFLSSSWNRMPFLTGDSTVERCFPSLPLSASNGGQRGYRERIS